MDKAAEENDVKGIEDDSNSHSHDDLIIDEGTAEIRLVTKEYKELSKLRSERTTAMTTIPLAPKDDPALSESKVEGKDMLTSPGDDEKGVDYYSRSFEDC